MLGQQNRFALATGKEKSYCTAEVETIVNVQDIGPLDQLRNLSYPFQAPNGPGNAEPFL
jgi:hypothetical protein